MSKWMQWNPQKYNPFGDKWSRCAAGRLMTFFGGIVVSSALTYYHVSKTKQSEYDEQLAQVKTYYKNQLSRDAVKTRVVQPDLRSDTVPGEGDIVIEIPEVVKVVNHYSALGSKEQELLKEYGSEQASPNDPQAIGKKFKKAPRPPQISIITRGEFEDEMLDTQTKTSFLYYDEDQVMLDPFNEVIDDHIKVVGSDFVDRFKQDQNTEVVYVRNLILNMDCEIELISGSYAVDVLGIDFIPNASSRHRADE